MAIRNDKRGQSWLLPPSVSDLIQVDHYILIKLRGHRKTKSINLYGGTSSKYA